MPMVTVWAESPYLSFPGKIEAWFADTEVHENRRGRQLIRLTSVQIPTMSWWARLDDLSFEDAEAIAAPGEQEPTDHAVEEFLNQEASPSAEQLEAEAAEANAAQQAEHDEESRRFLEEQEAAAAAHRAEVEHEQN